MSVVSQAASFYAWVPKRLPAPDRPTASISPAYGIPYFGLTTGLLPAHYVHQYWRIGETDTLTGSYRLLLRREVHFASGKLAAIETVHGEQHYTEAGTLWQRVRTTSSGTVITRRYRKNGRLLSVTRINVSKYKGSRRERNRRNGRMPLLRKPMRFGPNFR